MEKVKDIFTIITILKLDGGKQQEGLFNVTQALEHYIMELQTVYYVQTH